MVGCWYYTAARTFNMLLNWKLNTNIYIYVGGGELSLIVFRVYEIRRVSKGQGALKCKYNMMCVLSGIYTYYDGNVASFTLCNTISYYFFCVHRIWRTKNNSPPGFFFPKRNRICHSPRKKIAFFLCTESNSTLFIFAHFILIKRIHFQYEFIFIWCILVLQFHRLI